MFTGIVQGIARVKSVEGHASFKRLEVEFPAGALADVKQGASIALNGTCLTVTEFDEQASVAFFDVIQETLQKTNLNNLEQGCNLNYERAARIGDEIGGHLMSGHIHTCVEVLEVNKSIDNVTISLSTPNSFDKYLLEKGFVGLNGCSLTLGAVNAKQFQVHLIPETLKATTFGEIDRGERVNLEVDPQTQSIVDTVHAVLNKTQ